MSANQVPPPTDIASALVRELGDGELGPQVLITTRRLVIGYLLAVAIGVPLGFALGRWKLLHAAFEPLIEFARPMPVVAILPIAIFVLGLGDLMACSVIAFASGWIVLLHAMDGIRGVDPVLLDTGRVFRISGWRQFVTIILPAAAPHTFTGLRVGLGIAVIVTVVIELILGFGGDSAPISGCSRARSRCRNPTPASCSRDRWLRDRTRLPGARAPSHGMASWLHSSISGPLRPWCRRRSGADRSSDAMPRRASRPRSGGTSWRGRGFGDC